MRIPLPVTKRKARIEIIPLIDIVFFLLATFVMVSLSMVKNQGLPVNLPRAAAATAAVDNKQEAVTVGVTKSGEFFVNKDTMSFEQLSSRLASMKKSDPDLKLLVQGDEKADFGEAIRVLDEARRLGITKVTIQTRSKEAK
jgi:biopolymer transport protein ExbD